MKMNIARLELRVKKILCASVAVLSLVLVSCTGTVSLSGPIHGVSGNALLAVKDYETKGIIIVKSSEKIDGMKRRTGSKVTYEMLMEEARRLGADDVINVRVDENRVVKFENGREEVYTYTATALAIKYTEARDVIAQQQFQGFGGALPEETGNRTGLRWYHYVLGGVGAYIIIMLIAVAAN
jgi:uncharacterized protein YbjQ (UPF0145 family)